MSKNKMNRYRYPIGSTVKWEVTAGGIVLDSGEGKITAHHMYRQHPVLLIEKTNGEHVSLHPSWVVSSDQA